MPAGLALFTAGGFVLARLVWRPSPWRVLGFALALGTMEFLRGVVLTGFPWNVFGQALAEQAWFGQAASLVGVEGLTFLALFIFAAPAALASISRRRWAPVLCALLMLALLAGYGANRLAQAEVTFRASPVIRLIQPAVQQDDKFRPDMGPQLLALYLGLSVPNPPPGDLATSPAAAAATVPPAAAETPETLLLWPESAFPFLIEREPAALAEIGAVLQPGTTLLTGGARIEVRPGRRPAIYNAVLKIDQTGAIIGSYDKIHLVPFGEYLPFQDFFEGLGLQQLDRMPGGFAAGRPGQQNVVAAGIKLRPLICYEAVFPDEITGGERPNAFLNVTNDAWFGNTPGPYQHFSMSRTRSIEQGIPLVRVANSGISAIVDPFGRVVQHLSLGERAVLTGNFPNALEPTIYARLGRIATAALVFLMAVAYFLLGRLV
jgi:apolipoprotein N-acyltransferase